MINKLQQVQSTPAVTTSLEQIVPKLLTGLQRKATFITPLRWSEHDPLQTIAYLVQILGRNR